MSLRQGCATWDSVSKHEGWECSSEAENLSIMFNVTGSVSNTTKCLHSSKAQQKEQAREACPQGSHLAAVRTEQSSQQKGRGKKANVYLRSWVFAETVLIWPRLALNLLCSWERPDVLTSSSWGEGCRGECTLHPALLACEPWVSQLTISWALLFYVYACMSRPRVWRGPQIPWTWS